MLSYELVAITLTCSAFVLNFEIVFSLSLYFSPTHNTVPRFCLCNTKLQEMTNNSQYGMAYKYPVVAPTKIL